jgi:TfoX/Sxy family transcriptional regulator of competence genes
MTFDDQLAKRVRDILAEVPAVSERRMFGGLAFLVDGHMACGIVGRDLMLRLGKARADAALDQPHVRPMDFTARPTRTMVYIAAEGIVADRALKQWIKQAVTYVRTIPPKI